jgi:hypothetical protein
MFPRIEDQCDYCCRTFARMAGDRAVCPSCGLENVRPAAQRPESAMLAPAPEQAVLPRPAAKKRPARKGKV